MLTKEKLEKYTDVLLWGLKTARTQKYAVGDIVLVRYDRPAVALAEILQGRLLDMGLSPVMRGTVTPLMEHNFYGKSNARQLAFVAPGEKELCENLHGTISLLAPESMTHLRDIDSRRIGKTAVAHKFLRDILEERENLGEFGWTLCMMPTEELVRQAALTTRQYTNQIVRACYLDAPDPVRQWRSVHRNAAAIKKWLNNLTVKQIHVESKHIDLRITPGTKRKWVGISGHNIPSFEIFLSPDWRGTEGVYYANQPSFRSGNYIKGVRLVFKRGSVVHIEAEEGRDFVAKQISMDPGAKRVGEFSLTDKRFSRINRFMANTLFDENFGGTDGNCHLAVGASYPDTFDGDPQELTREKKRELGFNDSAVHWDLVNTEPKRVTALLNTGERKVIYEKGIFLF
jgi:aminopeptidase